MILSIEQFRAQTKHISKTKATSGRFVLSFVDVNVKVKYTRRFKALVHSSGVCPGCGATVTHLELTKLHNKDKPYAKIVPYGIRKDGTKVMMNCDHIVPQFRGGNHRHDNLQMMCVDCNQKKGSLLPSEIVMGKRWWKKNNLIENEMVNCDE